MKRKTLLACVGDGPVPTGVVVRLIRPPERRRWNDLMTKHPYLGNAHLVGETLRYVAEVDPQRFRGTSYRAAGWVRLGASKGFARRTRDYYLPHDQPNELLVKALYPRALEWLNVPGMPEPWAAAEQALAPQPAWHLPQWQSLYDLFGDLPDARSPHGRLHPVRAIVAIAAAAVLAGARGYLAITEFAAQAVRLDRWTDRGGGTIHQESVFRLTRLGTSASR